MSRLRAERALSNPATPAPTPTPYLAQALPGNHNLHPDQILDSLSRLGGDEGIASSSAPGTPAPTPYSPSPGHQLDPGQVAASIARLREEGVSTVNTQPVTPSGTPAGYLLPAGGVHNLGVIPEHLAEGINNSLYGRAGDEGLESGSNPATPTPTPFSPSPAGHHSLLAEQLAAGINRLRVETEGMSSGGSTGLPATPAPTPFSHGPGGVRPEDLAASISRLSVIQEADTGPAINILDASSEAAVSPAANPNNLSNYFGTPQNSGDSIFDQLSASPRSRATSESQAQPPLPGFTDITINTPVKRAAQAHRAQPSPLQVPGLASPLQGPPVTQRQRSPASGLEIEAELTPETQTKSKQVRTERRTPARELIPDKAGPQRPESPAVTRSGDGAEAELEMAGMWVPGPEAKEVLDSMASTPGTFYPQRDQLTMPGVSAGSEQGDPVRDGVAKYQGDAEASKRQVLGCDGVTADTRGLLQLVAAGNYRSAVNMTAQLLEMYGQGRGKVGQVSQHSATSLQIWWLRLALLVKLRLFSTAEAEAAGLWECERPDMFYQFYPEQFAGRRGSLAPWSLRLLLAELPMYNNKQVVTMNRLFRLQRSIRKMLGNLEKGLNADGEIMLEEKSEERRAVGIEMWKQRERQVLYSLVNCCVLHQDFESAVKCLDMLREVEIRENLASLHAAYGRVYLQLGNLGLADSSFSAAAEARDPADTGGQLDQLLDSAFLAVGQGQFQVALERFLGAEQLVGSMSEGAERQQRAKMISNNVAVCLLYVGSLKEGLERLQQEVTRDPSNIQGNMMLNLCTLYELESSYAMQKKIGMLGMVSQYSSDCFNMSMLKL